MSDEFRQKVRAFAERAVILAPRCQNEESTKLFLILPFLSLLGYDDRNPDEVCPEHSADFSDKYKNRVDFAVLKDGRPVIAIECKTVGLPLKDERGQLRAYFNAAPTVKMGLITDGLIYEFYADSDEQNMMDPSAFISIDLRDVAKGMIEESVEEGLRSLQKGNFNPDNIGAEAKWKLIFQKFVQQISGFAENPNEALVRMMLQNAGISHIRSKALTEYSELAKSAFREFINLRILQRLDLPTKELEKDKPLALAEAILTETKHDDGIVTTEVELDVFNYTKRRLSFLVKDDRLFGEIAKIEYRDYKGKFVVFYKRERAGRLFDFYEGRDKKFTFDFGEAFGGVKSTNRLQDIDVQLLAIFTRRAETAHPDDKLEK